MKCVIALSLLTPLPRCGSVVLDFMMRFNQSVVVSNVLTLLSDAARQEKFGGFKVNPDSIELVLIPTDGSESTTKGKNYKKIVYTYSFENGLFLVALGIYFIKQLISVRDILLGCFFLLLPLLNLNKILFLNFFMDIVAPYFSLVPSKSEVTFFFGHKPKWCIENSISTRFRVKCCVNVTLLSLYNESF